MTAVVSAKHARLQEVIARRKQWRDDLGLVQRLHVDVITAEGILAGTTLQQEGQPITNVTVQQRYAQWCTELRVRLQDATLNATERRCLEHFLHVTTNMSPRLFPCDDQDALPRTNNDLEGFIRSVKTRYRRISGRKNRYRYRIRYGARVAFSEARARTTELEPRPIACAGCAPIAGGKVDPSRPLASRSSSSSTGCAISATPTSPTWRPAGKPSSLVRDYCPDGFFEWLETVTRHLIDTPVHTFHCLQEVRNIEPELAHSGASRGVRQRQAARP